MIRWCLTALAYFQLTMFHALTVWSSLFTLYLATHAFWWWSSESGMRTSRSRRLAGKHSWAHHLTCVGKRSGGWNLFIISTSIHIETPALISNLPISKTGWAYQVQRGLIRLEIYLTHFPQFRLKLASSLFNCELLRV